MSDLFIDSSNFSHESEELIGGKAKSLFKLMNLGYQIPLFFVCTTNSFLSWREGKFDPIDLEKKINTLFKDNEFFAVRSSMNLEDGRNDSFAGLLDTFLYVHRSQVVEKVIACFKSIHNDRLKTYIDSKSITKEMKMAVIVQEMIDPVFSGVAFSRSPVGDSSLFLIESCPGLGEGLVSGTIESNTYKLNRFGEVVSKIEKNLTEGFFNNNGKVTLQSCEPNPINLNLLHKIKDILIALEKKLGFPVDIEWAYCRKNKKIILLQVRAITKSFSPLELYVDTNLSESYPGHVSRFTSSTINRLYKNIFIETASMLGASKSKLDKLKKHYSNLVADQGGHLYYHLESYYSALSALPGGKKNIDNWHKMIGGEPSKDININFEDLTPSFFENIKTYFSISKYFFFNKYIFNKFFNKYHFYHKERLGKLKKDLSLEEQQEVLKDLTSTDIGFGITAINDLLIMICLGILEKTIKSRSILVKILETNKNVKSLDPIQQFSEMQKECEDPEEVLAILSKVKDQAYLDWWKALQNKGFHQISHLLSSYLDKYGDRCFEELKFESPTFSDSPKDFYTFLTWNLRSNTSFKKKSNEQEEISLNISSRIILYFLRNFIEKREHSRLLRGKHYSLIRQTFHKIVKLSKESLNLKETHSSFFHLSLDQMLSIQNISSDELKNQLSAPALPTVDSYPEFLTIAKGDTPYFLSRNNSFQGNIQNLKNGDIVYGLGASAYQTEGEILILNTPEEAINIELSNKIIVTDTTDPAWVFIMAKCKGLISQKGSLLSHTAIIGRELKIPTVVGVKSACKIFSNSQIVNINGELGKITLIKDLAE